MINLKVISSTVRPGRKGPIVAQWIAEEAEKHGAFKAEVLDLGEIGLPVFDEPNHPIMQQYTHAHTKAWSQKIAEADAFIFVTAEYDHSYPASLKNAIEYLVREWQYKPAAIVSYSGGHFAGVRAAAQLKADLIVLSTVTIPETVTIPNLDQHIDSEGNFQPNDIIASAKDLMLNQLIRWSSGMTHIRENRPVPQGVTQPVRASQRTATAVR